jgi:RHS repeat-associated protein
VSGNSTWTPSFYVYDGGGSVRQLTNSNGTVTDEYEYDAYGNSFTKSGTTPNNYLYRGEQYDADLSLYYLRARYYNPATGRFLSRDPEDGVPTEPATLHKYDYAGSNPVNAMDPTGRSSMVEYLLPIGIIDLGPQKRQTLYDKYTNQYVTTTAPQTMLALMNLGCAVRALFVQASYTAKGIASDTDFVLCTAWPQITAYSFFKQWWKDVKNCVGGVGWPAIADDLNPLIPGATDAAGNIFTALSQGQYNAALTYAASVGLTYPNKFSIFRGLMGNSSKLATAAEAMPMVALDKALLAGVIAEWNGCQ